MSRRDIRVALALVTVVAIILIGGVATAFFPPTIDTAHLLPSPTTPGADEVDLYAAVREEDRQFIVDRTRGSLSQYTIRAALIPPGTSAEVAPAELAGASELSSDHPTIVGVEELRFVNTTGTSLSEIQLRLYPNLRQYGDGRMTIDTLTVDGIPVAAEAPPLHSVPASTPVATPTPDMADLILIRVPLRTPLAPNESALVSMRFTTTVPVSPPDESGLFRYHPDAGQWTLGHWFPILAGYDPATGWQSDPPAAWSDITFANTSLYDVTLTTPEDLVLVTPGVEVSRERQGSSVDHRYVTGPARDFPVVAQPDLQVAATVVNGVIVASYAPADAMDGARITLRWAAQALKIYSEVFGPYPYATLDVVAVPGMVGYEFPQMLTLGADFYPDPAASGSRPGAIEFLVAHEVAHQWWYGLVGSNPHRHAFLDEGLAEYSAVLYFERTYGNAAAESQLYDGLVLRYASTLVNGGDMVADQPTSGYPDELSYYAITYRKAGLGFAAIREAIGDEAFFSALNAYASQMRFGVATPDDLLTAFETTSGQDLCPLWRMWFEETRGKVGIVMEPAPSASSATPAASPASATPVDRSPR